MSVSSPIADCRLPHRRRGFTLIEVLVALLFITIVLPALMQGISIATSMAAEARHRTEAAGLAQSKMAEIISGTLWQNGNTNGDFADWPDYHWQLSVAPWANDQTGQNMQQLDLTVTYQSRNKQKSITLSSLAYLRSTQ